MGLLASFFINFLAHVIRMQERGLAFSITQISPKLFLLILISLIMLFDLKAEFYTLMLMNTLAIIVFINYICLANSKILDCSFYEAN